MSTMMITNPTKRHSLRVIPGDDKDCPPEFMFRFNALSILYIECGLAEGDLFVSVPCHVPHALSVGKRQ